MTRFILNMLFGRRLARQTSQYLYEIESAPIRASNERATRALTALAENGEPTVTLGTTAAGQAVRIPLSEIMTSMGLFTGATGSGKSSVALLVCQTILQTLVHTRSLGLGVLDPKGELFYGVLFLLSQILNALDRSDPDAAADLRSRVVIVDFAADDPVSPYNIVYPGVGVEPDVFADNRADLLLDLLPARDNLSLSGKALLRRAILFLAELKLPISLLPDLLQDENLHGQLIRRCANKELGKDFERQLAIVSKQTIAALSRRIDALFASRNVRLSLDGASAPDLRSLQDAGGKLILVNTFGVSSSVRELLQGIVISDITQSVFARKSKEKPFLWIIDEAQNCFLTESLRDQMCTVLTMARSFGSFFLFLTQNISAAVHDTRLLNQLHTNVKWSFSMRGSPLDCGFLKAALPVTARKPRPRTNPYEPVDFYTINEERAMELDGIANLPDREGFLWLRSHSSEAVRITTQSISIPKGDALEKAIRPLLSDPAMGARVSRPAYEADLKQRRDTSKEPIPADMNSFLAGAYKRTRGRRP